MEWKNELTKQLLEQGVTEDNFPPYIKEYHPFYGGFIYKPEHCRTLRYQTGCGLTIPGSEVIGMMSYLGYDWSYENFNPAILCPYDKEDCEKNHPVLRKKSLNGFCFCRCHPVEAENSQRETLQETLAKEDIRQKKLLKDYIRENNGSYCLHHMRFDKQAGTWLLDYKPIKCSKCKKTDCCTLLKIPLSAQKGNVYYDCRVEYTSEDSIFHDVPAVTIYKNIPVLEEPVSMTICERIAELCSEEIIQEEFFHPYGMPQMASAKNFHVRAIANGVREAESDGSELEDGARILYYGDLKLDSQMKKEKQKSETFSRNVKIMEKYVLEHGFEDLREYEKRRIRKFLDEKQIEGLLKKREFKNQDTLFNPL